jgi:HK97 family phage prohead protease
MPATPTTDSRAVVPDGFTEDPNAAPDAGELAFYHPIPYRVDADEDVTCPHCQLKNDTDATFCDQCGTELAGRDDVTVGDSTVTEPYSPEPYDPEVDETVQCPDCEKRNDPDARFCDQCGVGLVGRTDVNVDGPYEDVDNVNTESQAAEPDSEVEDVNDDSQRSAPTHNLIRVRSSAPAAPAVLLRDDPVTAAGSSGSLMFGYFSTFNDWYEIDDWYEGSFLERVAPGAYAQTIADDRASMRVLYDHGFDPQLGNKPLGPIQTLREDKIGPYFEVPLLDTDYNRNFLLPALRGQLISGQQVGSQLGASFRFIVTGEEWDRSGKVTPDNPRGLGLRTITATKVLEFGPVTFPANDAASTGIRSTRATTHLFIDRLRSDHMALARFTERTSAKVVERLLVGTPTMSSATNGSTPEPDSDDVQAAQRRSFSLRARLMLADSQGVNQ